MASIAAAMTEEPVRGALPPYTRALGLTSNPFPVTPDETQYFFTPALEAIYAEVSHFIQMRKGFLLLTGDIGLGKTTLLRRLLASFDKAHYNTALILTSFLDQAELLEVLAHDFGLKVPPGSRRIDHLTALNNFLLAESAKGKINVLFIDDAQALDAHALDVVRQLSNLETADTKHIQVVLSGQQELADTLNQFSLRQVKSRIALHRQLQPLDATQTLSYIHYRLGTAGAADCVTFTASGGQMMFACTAGFPRRIHHLMDRCLYDVVVSGGPIDGPLVLRAAQDLGWPAPGLDVAGAGNDAALAPAPIAARSGTGWVRRTGMTALALSLLGLAVLAGYGSGVGRQAPTTMPVAVTPVPVAIPVGLPFQVAEPESWNTDRSAYLGLASLDWPAETTLAALTENLQDQLQLHRWKPLLAQGDWVPACIERPLLTLHDAQGTIWQLAFVELVWPVSPVVLGQSSMSVRMLQKFLQTQGLLGMLDIDSAMGPRTAAALARFQLAEGIESTGQFSPATAYRLSCRLAHSSATFNGAGS